MSPAKAEGISSKATEPERGSAKLNAKAELEHLRKVNWRKFMTCVTSFLESLLKTDDRHEAEELLCKEDATRIPWLRTVAKVASRDITIMCMPVSLWAHDYLLREILHLKDTTTGCLSAEGFSGWWMVDRSTQIDGKVRALRLVSDIIRAETVSHAFDSTPRRKPRKDQKQHNHSVFRQLAYSFVPPPASPEAIARTQSNHAVAGASRNVGITATRDHLNSAGLCGFDPSISGAARDSREGTVGRRDVHDIKDLQHANPNGTFKPGMVYTFVDQDMYIDSFARFAGENMVIVTPEYDKLAGYGTDSVWYYTTTNKTKSGQPEVVVAERVASDNGATYKMQRPWNYTENDFIFIEHQSKTAFTTYNVHIQYQAGSHHKWVWLARNSTTSLSKSLCDMMYSCVNEEAGSEGLNAVALKKADNVVITYGDSGLKQDTFLLGFFGDPTCPTYSIKYAHDIGPENSMELTERQFKVFNLMGKNRPKGYGVSEVARTLKMHTIWRPGGLEPLLVNFFGIPVEYRPLPNIMYTRQYGSADEGDDVGEDGPAVEAAPNPFGGGPGVAETRSDAAHEAYMEKRFKPFCNKTVPPENVERLADMLMGFFIKQVSGETAIALNSVSLCGRQVIIDKRTQALQAARLKRHTELLAKPGAHKTNLKSEVGPKASAAPRGVTQMNEEMAIQSGRVGLLIKEILKHCSFFMPGKNPHDIATAIRNLTEIADQATNDAEPVVSGVHDTDYSKMDETISEFIFKKLFVRFVMAFVHPTDAEEVKKILMDCVDTKATLNGTTYNTGYKNLSGSGITTELNTLVSAFIEYASTCLAITKASYRKVHKKELDLKDVKNNTVRAALMRYAKDQQLAHLFWGDFMFKEGKEVDIWSVPYAVTGAKFGDDGVGPSLPGISDADWDGAAMFFTGSIGMILKVSFSRPEDGTFFLGRFYPRPLESLASYADVLKSCRKISIARNMVLEKYVLKLRGYWTTDSKTPGIREYLLAVARLYDVKLEAYEGIVELDDDGRPVLSEDMAYLLANDKDMFYRVANGPYCVADEDVAMMTDHITQTVKFEPASEFEAWCDSLAKSTTWEELDEFLLPGTDFDPDAEPEGTVRMSGPAASLLAAGTPQSSAMSASHAASLEELAFASELALEQLLEEQETTDEPDSAAVA